MKGLPGQEFYLDTWTGVLPGQELYLDRSFICPTSYSFGKGRDPFSVPLVRQTSQLPTVTNAYTDREATRADGEDAIFGSPVRMPRAVVC